MTTKELIDALQSIDEIGYIMNLEGTVLIKDNKLWVEYINEQGTTLIQVIVGVNNEDKNNNWYNII